MSGSSGEQTIVCGGCGCKWRMIRGKSAIVARLIVCPLCALEEDS